MNDIKDRTDLAKYDALIQGFMATLGAVMDDCTIKGLKFQVDVSGSYPAQSLELHLTHPDFDKYTELLEVKLHVFPHREPKTGRYLAVEYRSAESKKWSARGGRRDIRLTGNTVEQAQKLMKRAVTRYEEAVAARKAREEADAAAEARKKQWYADFTGPDGKLVIPLDFAYAYTTPGEYAIDTGKSTALRCRRWKKEEVLKLTALLAEVRGAMVADGRIVVKPKTEEN